MGGRSQQTTAGRRVSKIGVDSAPKANFSIDSPLFRYRRPRATSLRPSVSADWKRLVAGGRSNTGSMRRTMCICAQWDAADPTEPDGPHSWLI